MYTIGYVRGLRYELQSEATFGYTQHLNGLKYEWRAWKSKSDIRKEKLTSRNTSEPSGICNSRRHASSAGPRSWDELLRAIVTVHTEHMFATFSQTAGRRHVVFFLPPPSAVQQYTIYKSKSSLDEDPLTPDRTPAQCWRLPFMIRAILAVSRSANLGGRAPPADCASGRAPNRSL